MANGTYGKCTKTVHWMRDYEAKICLDGIYRHICFCGQIRFTLGSIVPGMVVK